MQLRDRTNTPQGAKLNAEGVAKERHLNNA